MLVAEGYARVVHTHRSPALSSADSWRALSLQINPHLIAEHCAILVVCSLPSNRCWCCSG